MTMLLTDLRLGIRSLKTAPGFTAAAIVTLGLAMTLSITVLAVINAYLFTQLPYPAATRLYSVRYSAPGSGAAAGVGNSSTGRRWTTSIEHPIAWDLDMFYVLGGENAESVPGAWVTRGFVRGPRNPAGHRARLRRRRVRGGQRQRRAHQLPALEVALRRRPIRARTAIHGLRERPAGRSRALHHHRRPAGDTSGTSTRTPTFSRRCARRRIPTWSDCAKA